MQKDPINSSDLVALIRRLRDAYWVYFDSTIPAAKHFPSSTHSLTTKVLPLHEWIEKNYLIGVEFDRNDANWQTMCACRRTIDASFYLAGVIRHRVIPLKCFESVLTEREKQVLQSELL